VAEAGTPTDGKPFPTLIFLDAVARFPRSRDAEASRGAAYVGALLRWVGWGWMAGLGLRW
jgi:hypothetical protein